MVGMWDNNVILRLDTGRQVNVPMDSLNAESRIQAKKVAVRLNDSRRSLSAELQSAANAEAAPAPEPLPEPTAVASYSPLAPNAKPDQAWQQIQDELRRGHLIVLYDAMPLSYRNEFDGLVRLVMQKLEPTSWNNSLTNLHRLADLVVTHQNWIRSYPRLVSSGSETNDPNQIGQFFQDLILPLAGLCRVALPPDQTGTASIGSSSFGEWLRQRDEASAPYVAMLMEKYGTSASSWTIAEGTKDPVVLQAQGPPSTTGAGSMLSVSMTKVDGYWIPVSVAEGFSDWIKEQTNALEKHDDATMTVSQWLGGQAVNMNSFASNSNQSFDPSMNDGFSDPDQFNGGPSRSERAAYEASMAQQMQMDMDMNEDLDDYDMDDYDMDDYESSGSGYSSMPRGKAAEFEPSPLDPEMIGSLLQSVGVLGGMVGPLESASDASMFHQAMEQVVSPLASLVDMIGS